MKKISLIILVLVIGALQSCTIFSLHPLYEEDDLLEEPGLTGVWRDTGDGDEFVSFEQLDNKKYLFRYMEARADNGHSTVKKNGMPFDYPAMDTLSFEAGLVKIGEHFFIDLFPYYDGEKDEGYYLLRNFIPTHSFMKIEWVENEMTLFMFEPDRMKKLFEQNRIRIKHEIINDDYIIITASTQDLQQFIKKYADDSAAFDEPEIFRKIE